jgi:hypothetical protein
MGSGNVLGQKDYPFRCHAISDTINPPRRRTAAMRVCAELFFVPVADDLVRSALSRATPFLVRPGT